MPAGLPILPVGGTGGASGGHSGSGHGGAASQTSTSHENNAQSTHFQQDPNVHLSTSNLLHNVEHSSSASGGHNGATNSDSHDFTGLGTLNFSASDPQSFDHSNVTHNSSFSHSQNAGSDDSGSLLSGLA